MYSKRTPLALAVALSLCATPYAFAENKTDDSLEKIEVVGQPIKRSSAPTGLDLSVKETPQSISIIDSDFIEQFNLNNLEDVLTQATGVSRFKYGVNDNTYFNARGFEVNSLIKDGLPNGLTEYAQEHRLDSAIYERIEILRGSAGLMAGAGEPSATINVITKKPTRERLANIGAEIGTNSHKRLEVDVSDALTHDEALAGRAVAVYEDGGTDIVNENLNKVVLYTQLHSYLGKQEDTEVSFSAYYQDTEQKGLHWGMPIYYSDGSRLNSFDKETTLASPNAVVNRTAENYMLKLTHQLSLDWQLNFAAQLSQTESDEVFTMHDGFPDKDTGLGMLANDRLGYVEDETVTFVASAIGRIEFLDREHQLNITYVNTELNDKRGFKEDMVELPVGPGMTVQIPGFLPIGSIFEKQPAKNINLPANPQVTQKSSTEITESTLAISGKIELSDQLFSILGVKAYEYEEKRYLEQPIMGRVTNENFDNDGFSSYLGFVYEVNSQVNTYVSYTDTYQPQFNTLDINLKPIDAITGRNLEAGIKSSLFEDKLTINLSVFDMLKKNVAEIIPEFNKPGIEPRFRPIDGAKSKGFEFEIDGNITENWDLVLGYSQFSLKDQQGNNINKEAPRKTININTRYQIGDFRLGLAANWNEETTLETLFVDWSAQELVKDAVTIVNANIGYQVSENLDVQLNIKNLFDKEYWDTLGYVPQRYGASRAFSLSANYSF